MITGFLSQEREINRQWQNPGDAYSSKIKALLLSGIKALLQTLEEIILLYTIVHFTALSNHLKNSEIFRDKDKKDKLGKERKEESDEGRILTRFILFLAMKTVLKWKVLS